MKFGNLSYVLAQHEQEVKLKATGRGTLVKGHWVKDDRELFIKATLVPVDQSASQFSESGMIQAGDMSLLVREELTDESGTVDVFGGNNPIGIKPGDTIIEQDHHGEGNGNQYTVMTLFQDVTKMAGFQEFIIRRQIQKKVEV